EDLLLTAAWIEAGDVLSNGSIEQLNVLRQVSDVLAKLVSIPLVQRSAIETDLTTLERPYTHQRARQGRLARRTWPDDPPGLPRCQRKIQTLEDNLRRSQGGCVNVRHGEITTHRRQGDSLRHLGYLLQLLFDSDRRL